MNYKEHTTCRYCDDVLTEVIKLGDNYPLAGGFMRSPDEFHTEKTYPLSLGFCKQCCLLQCMQIIHEDTLFRKGYFYYSSMLPMLRKHFSAYAAQLASSVHNPKDTCVVEIGCNDGVFLRPLREHGFQVIGVDPSDTVLQCIKEGFTIYNTYFNEALANTIVKEHGQCDIFLSSNSFAHIDDMKSIMNGIKNLLKPNGQAIIEVHYSKYIIDELQFDFIYHEHMSYYTISSFDKIAQRYGMSLENVEITNIHGKSIRVYLRNTPNITIAPHIQHLMDDEVLLTNTDTYLIFNTNLHLWKQTMLETLEQYKEKRIYGFGSSGRSNIICRLLDLRLDQIIDDAPSKIGSYTPIYHNCIISSEILKTASPDLLIILAWPYANDIITKIRPFYKGQILIPLPTLQLLTIE